MPRRQNPRYRNLRGRSVISSPGRNRRRSSRPPPLHGRPLSCRDKGRSRARGAPCVRHTQSYPHGSPPQATEGIVLRKVRTERLSISEQALSGDTLRFIDRGTKGKSVPRPAPFAAGRSSPSATSDRAHQGLPVLRPSFPVIECICLYKWRDLRRFRTFVSPLRGHPFRLTRHHGARGGPSGIRNRCTYCRRGRLVQSYPHRPQTRHRPQRELLYGRYVRKNYRNRRRRFRGTSRGGHSSVYR